MTIGRYRDREPGPFRAVQFDGTNADEIIEFSGGAARWQGLIFAIPEPFIEPTDDEVDEIAPGDWVIESEDGTYYLQYDREEFARDFEEA